MTKLDEFIQTFLSSTNPEIVRSILSGKYNQSTSAITSKYIAKYRKLFLREKTQFASLFVIVDLLPSPEKSVHILGAPKKRPLESPKWHWLFLPPDRRQWAYCFKFRECLAVRCLCSQNMKNYYSNKSAKGYERMI